MVNKELYAILARKTDYNRKEIQTIFDSILETLKEMVSSGEMVRINNLGAFKLKIQKATRQRDINSGVIFNVPQKKKLVFTHSRRLNVNKVAKRIQNRGVDSTDLIISKREKITFR